MRKLSIVIIFSTLVLIKIMPAQPELGAAKVVRNVVYGMYSGLALLLDVYYPEKPNGYAVIHISGSGWSKPLSLDAPMLNHQGHVKLEGEALVKAGYTVFSINHRATPRFTYPDAIEDAQRAVRFMRYHAKKYGIKADRIGAVGGSSGGHLVCMLGVLDGEGDPNDPSPINRESAKVQCVVARAAPTSLVSGLGSMFLNVNQNMLQDTLSEEYQRALEASPINYITADDPPILFLHGDQDDRVPIEQSKDMYEKMQAQGIPAELLIIAGAGHGPDFPGALNLPDLGQERLNWLETYLIKTQVSLVENITYKTIADMELKLDLYLPQTDKKKPLIVWVHGGAWKMGNRSNPIAHPLLTDAGFAVASISYRFSQEAIFPAQIEDCKAAIRWLKANGEKYSIDPNRVGVWGASAGGHLVALLGTTGDTQKFDIGDNLDQSSAVQAVCNWYGPTDFLQMDAHAYPGSELSHNATDSPESQLIGGPIQKNKKNALRANPISYASSDDPPMLIMHGDQDKVVPIHQSQMLYEALKKVGAPVQFYVVKGGGHGGKEFWSFDHQKMVLDFFEEQLKN